MNEQEIFSSLASLEKNLQGIDSARKQVQNVVSTYETVNVQLNIIANEMAAISKDLKIIFSSISQNQDALTSQINGNINDAFLQLNDKIQSLNVVSDAIQNKFDKSCKKLTNSFSSEVDASIKNLNAEVLNSISQFNDKAQDNMDRISQTIQEFKKTANGMTSNFSSNLDIITNTHNNTNDEIVSNLRQESSRRIDELNNLKKEFDSVLAIFKDLVCKLNLDNRKTVEIIQDRINSMQGDIISHIDNSIESLKLNLNMKIDSLVANISDQNKIQQQFNYTLNKQINDLTLLQKKSIKRSNILMTLLIVCVLLGVVAIFR